jgi:hypothetical protein
MLLIVGVAAAITVKLWVFDPGRLPDCRMALIECELAFSPERG